MRETREDEAPSGDQLEGVREAGREAELDVLHQHLLKDLGKRKREINGPAGVVKAGAARGLGCWVVVVRK